MLVKLKTLTDIGVSVREKKCTKSTKNEDTKIGILTKINFTLFWCLRQIKNFDGLFGWFDVVYTGPPYGEKEPQFFTEVPI